MKTTVVYHSADFDGLFCREIARKFLPGAELIGWDFADPPLQVPEGLVYVLDLPCDRPFGAKFPGDPILRHPVWIDHHKSSIDSHPADIPGYRIDGVAACRLTWQWFKENAADAEDRNYSLPSKQDYLDRRVSEPLAVRRAGEYDIWDHRDNDADIAFQFGLDSGSQEDLNWSLLIDTKLAATEYTSAIVTIGRSAQRCYKNRDAAVMRERSFLVDWEGLKFLALTTARCNSNTFAARDIPETGHDALMAFWFNGKAWTFSLYHAAHRKDLDLSQIAAKYGGGGYRGACGFRTPTLPFLS